MHGRTRIYYTLGILGMLTAAVAVVLVALRTAPPPPSPIDKEPERIAQAIDHAGGAPPLAEVSVPGSMLQAVPPAYPLDPVEMPPFPLGEDLPPADRIRSAQVLPLDLPGERQEQILAFLPHITHLGDMDAGDRQYLADIFFENLRLQQNPLPGFPAVLQGIYRDQSTDVIIRGYAVQHIGLWQLARPHDPDLEVMLWDAASMATEPFAGMALIALDRLVDAGQPVDEKRLDAISVRTAATPSAHIASRMCALDVGARRSVDGILLTARELARSSAPLTLQLAAIHAIGLLGNEQDLEQLTRWSREDGSHLRIAAIRALEQLQTRESN